MLLRHVEIAASILLAPVKMGARKYLPVLAPIGITKSSADTRLGNITVLVRRRILLHIRLHSREYLAGIYYKRVSAQLKCRRETCNHRIAASYSTGKIATEFCGIGDTTGSGHATNFPIPLLAPKEEQLVLLYRAPKRIAVVIAPQNRFVVVRIGVNRPSCRMNRTFCSVIKSLLRGKPVIGIQGIVSARVEGAAMPGVAASPSHNVDDATGSLSVFRTVSVAQQFEFSDGFEGRINKDRAVGTDVVVVCAINQEQVVGHRIPVHREIDAALESFADRVKTLRSGNAGLQLCQLYEIPAVKWQLPHLLAVHDARQLGVVGLHLNLIGLHCDLFRCASKLKYHVCDCSAGHVQINVVGD